MAQKLVKVTLMKSTVGQLRNIVGCVRGLGLRKPRQVVTVADTPANRGMIATASHMLKVESA